MRRICVCFECGKRWIAEAGDHDALVRAILAGHRRAQPFCREIGDVASVEEDLAFGEATSPGRDSNPHPLAACLPSTDGYRAGSTGIVARGGQP